MRSTPTSSSARTEARAHAHARRTRPAASPVPRWALVLLALFALFQAMVSSSQRAMGQAHFHARAPADPHEHHHAGVAHHHHASDLEHVVIVEEDDHHASSGHAPTLTRGLHDLDGLLPRWALSPGSNRPEQWPHTAAPRIRSRTTLPLERPPRA